LQIANMPSHRVDGCHSLSPTKPCLTLPVYLTRKYAQLLRSKLYIVQPK